MFAVIEGIAGLKQCFEANYFGLELGAVCLVLSSIKCDKFGLVFVHVMS